ncbi:MAG: phosphoribosyltransferase family protein [Patescibacteria group bacterium]|nr:phosphoribosyltransferase family protein [Patescibacteria group bacterium]
MPFNSMSFESMLSGSLVAFKKRERPPLTEQEKEFKLENERKLQGGIGILRKLRTQALAEQDPSLRQNYLEEAHEFSTQMADVILNQALSEKPSPISPVFLEELQKKKEEYADKDADSGHATPPQFSITNLFRAIDDMLARVEEKAQSITSPDHRLTQDEIRYVLQEFLRGTNDLTVNAVEKFFKKNTKISGILSGGSVYVELVKKIIEKYGDHSINVDSFVIAVDKESKKAVFEASETDATTQTVIIADDMVDKGGTLLTALWAAGEQFPNATIYSGLGTDQPGGFEKRRTEKYLGHLVMLFQDFADLSEEGKNKEALAILKQAEQYAKENRVTLPPGWYKRKERMDG